ncbi:MAG: M23 family metallopeptidase [bacterium]|nr:M23 family metallopeptidase [bacterium]
MEPARDYRDDDNLDFSDLSDLNQSALEKAKSRWGSAEVIRGNDGYNPSALADTENSSATSQRAQDEDITSNEKSPWENQVSGQKNDGGTHKSRNAKLGGKSKFFSRRAKIAAALFGGGSVLGVGFFSTFIVGMAPFHITEMITEKLNSTASILDIRGSGIMATKLRASSGTKCNLIKTACKFTNISEKQLSKLKKAGFDVELDGGGKKIKSLTKIDANGNKIGEAITESNLKNALKTDVEFRTSMDKAYKGTFASFLDDMAAKFMGKIGLGKAPPDNRGKTEAEIETEVNEKTNKTGSDADLETNSREEVADADDANTKQSKTKNNADLDTTDEFIRDVRSGASDAVKGGPSAKASAIDNAVKKANILQIPCTLWGVGNMINIGVKAIRAVKLAQFALTFLSFADKIKAGQATPEEAAMIGNKLTGISSEWSGSSNDNSNENQSKLQSALAYFAETTSQTSKVKSFTDSQGWRAMAYNDNIGKLNDSAAQYSTGAVGVFAQFWTGLRGAISSVIGSSSLSAITKFCKVLTSDAVDKLLMVVSAATLTGFAFDLIGDIVIGEVIGRALSPLPELLAGEVVSSFTKGEDYGNAVMSGAGSLMSKNTVSGGGGTLTTDEAVAFYQRNEVRIAENGAFERATRSPFDATTRHTFLGSIVSSALPYTTQLSSISGFLPAMSSIVSKSISSVLPGASAADSANFKANMNLCQDSDIKSLGIATDAFCNPYTGISNTTLDKNPEDVIQWLVDNGHIDPEEENPTSAIKSNQFKDYVKKCMERESPIGIGDDPEEMGGNCSTAGSYGQAAAYFAAYMTDIRVQEGMETDFKPVSGSSSNNRSSGTTREVSSGDWHSPIDGATSKNFASNQLYADMRQSFGFHTGLDFGILMNAYPNTPVYSIGNGTVKKAEADPYGYCGNYTVTIEHEEKYQGQTVYSYYCHMKSSNVKVGDKVTAKTQIGTVGCEGQGCGGGFNTSGPESNAHLHMETHQGTIGNHFDPLLLNNLGLK